MNISASIREGDQQSLSERDCQGQPDVIAFFRAYPQTRETMCSEVVAAWLRSGGVAVPYERPAMLRLWKRGLRAGAALAARRLGFAPVADPRAGDVVLLAQEDGSEVMGVCAGAACVAAAGGSVVMTTDAPIMAWRRS